MVRGPQRTQIALSGTPVLDVPSLRAGGSVALVFAIPFSIAARIVADDGNSSLAVWLTIGALVGFVIGSGCAAWVQPLGTPLLHGMVTASGTYLVAQTVFVIVRLLRGGEVRWFAIAFNLSVVVFAGLIGGLLGQHLRQRGFAP